MSPCHPTPGIGREGLERVGPGPPGRGLVFLGKEVESVLSAVGRPLRPPSIYLGRVSSVALGLLMSEPPAALGLVFGSPTPMLGLVPSEVSDCCIGGQGLAFSGPPHSLHSPLYAPTSHCGDARGVHGQGHCYPTAATLIHLCWQSLCSPSKTDTESGILSRQISFKIFLNTLYVVEKADVYGVEGTWVILLFYPLSALQAGAFISSFPSREGHPSLEYLARDLTVDEV